MEFKILPQAQDDLDAMDRSLAVLFIKHMRKISLMPPRRHMQFGLPYHVEEVTKQARMPYLIQDEKLNIVRCFATHKEYQKWYESQKR